MAQDTNMETLEKKLDIPIGQEVSGSELYMYTLEMLGAEKIFALTGGRVLHLLDTLSKSDKLTLISGPHEQDLGHVAQAYFKITRKPGILITTSGPGGTNAGTSVKDAHSDSDGLILTVGQVSLESLRDGEEAFQGAAIFEALQHWSKWAYRITNAEEVQRVVKTAYHLATSGRPGSIVLEFPSPVAQMQKAKLKPLEEVALFNVDLKHPQVYKSVKVKNSNLNDLTTEINKSKRPLIIAGGGIYNAGAVEEFLKFSEHTDTPFATTLMLIGAIPSDHGLNLGLPGMHGSPESNLAINNSDLLVYLGGRLDDRIISDPSKFAPNANIFWIEPNNPGIGRGMASRVNKIRIGAKEALGYLLGHSEKSQHIEWRKQIAAWREKYPMPIHTHRNVIEAINMFTRKYEQREPYITTGVGAHQMFVAEYWKFNPEIGKKMLLTSGGLGTMGVGTPFGVGAIVADPGRTVYVFNGDGSLLMDQRSLTMPRQLRKKGMVGPLKEIVFRDNSLGMVDCWQAEFYEDRKAVSEIDLEEDYFSDMAKQNNMRYFVLDSKDIPSAHALSTFEEFVKYRHEAFLEIRMQPQSVKPMVPSMKGVADIILPGELKLDPSDLGKSEIDQLH